MSGCGAATGDDGSGPADVSAADWCGRDPWRVRLRIRSPSQVISPPDRPADYTIRIAAGLSKSRPIASRDDPVQQPVSGPLIRLREGRPVVVDVFNDTDLPEQLHWHGHRCRWISTDRPKKARRNSGAWTSSLEFHPGPPGLRFYHTHAFAGADLRAGHLRRPGRSVYIEAKNDAGAYDQEAFLVLKEFSPSFTPPSTTWNGFLLPDEPDKS